VPESTDRSARLERKWVVKRIAINLDRSLYAWMQAQRGRLHSLSDSELVRDLLREHQSLTQLVANLRDRVVVLERAMRRLERRLGRK